MRLRSLLLVFVASGCVALTPEGARVSVYEAPLEEPPATRAMPESCRVIATKPAVEMPELDLKGQKDPFRVERNEADAAGANVLLILSRMTISRHDTDCPAASPITDCAGSFGAWFHVVIQSYSCSPDGLRQLATPPK